MAIIADLIIPLAKSNADKMLDGHNRIISCVHRVQFHLSYSALMLFAFGYSY
jgi:hypothetical protein